MRKIGTIYLNIKVFSPKRRLTQAKLAKKVGTTSSAISRYENVHYGKYEINTIRKIVEACGGELLITISKPDA